MSVCADSPWSHAYSSLCWNQFMWTFQRHSQRHVTSDHVKAEKVAPKIKPWCHTFHQSKSILQQHRLYQLHGPYRLLQDANMFAVDMIGTIALILWCCWIWVQKGSCNLHLFSSSKSGETGSLLDYKRKFLKVWIMLPCGKNSDIP